MVQTKTKVRNIGIPNVEPPEATCDDIHCPFHGNLSVRGRITEGIVTSTMMRNTIAFQQDYLSLVKKYSRYERRRSKKLAHHPPCISLKVGDTVKVIECRPVSKNVSSVVVAVTHIGEAQEE
ncbi:MAG: 30S ribosomal protein S17 [Candidatus Thorarchaeota archaeon]|nr:MAG: 30S ribosomal protein S17 [Candidatus Thorarchaeota archaeon]